MSERPLSGADLEEVNEPEAFSWIANALRGPVGEQPRGDHLRTLDLIPPSFESYAKVLHPVFRRDETAASEFGSALWEEPRGLRVRWPEAASESGVPYDAALPDSSRSRRPPHLSLEYEGSIPPSILRAIVRVLDRPEAAPAYFWWWVVVALFGFGPPRQSVPDRHVLCRGPLRALPDFLAREKRASPTYWWAADRTWCVATDWDLCFTMIGGTPSTIRRLLAEPEIEGFEVASDSVLLRYSKLRPAEG